MDASTKKRLEAFLDEKGLRRTTQREAIIEAAFGSEDHFSADDLLARAKAKESTVSRATVYRTLPLLCESGLLRELDLGRGHKFYDPNYSRFPDHNHIICDDCDRIVEFTSREMSELEGRISSQLGFKLASQKVQLHGSCQKLKESGSCEQKLSKCRHP